MIKCVFKQMDIGCYSLSVAEHKRQKLFLLLCENNRYIYTSEHNCCIVVL